MNVKNLCHNWQNVRLRKRHWHPNKCALFCTWHFLSDIEALSTHVLKPIWKMIAKHKLTRKQKLVEYRTIKFSKLHNSFPFSNRIKTLDCRVSLFKGISSQMKIQRQNFGFQTNFHVIHKSRNGICRRWLAQCDEKVLFVHRQFDRISTEANQARPHSQQFAIRWFIQRLFLAKNQRTVSKIFQRLFELLFGEVFTDNLVLTSMMYLLSVNQLNSEH